MTISERVEAGRRERRVLTRVSRAGWRLEQAERERVQARVSARAEGVSIRKLAAAAGLSPSRVHQLVAAADLDALDAALGELRAAGWPAPEDPDSGEDTELGGRDSIAGRLSDEVSWLRQCADWLAHLDADSSMTARTRVRSTATRARTASPPTLTSWPGPGGSRTWAPPRCCPARGPNAAGAWPSRTWSSGPSAPGGGCPLRRPSNWSGPGTPGRPSGTSATRSASGPATPAARSGHADGHPCHIEHQGSSANWTP